MFGEKIAVNKLNLELDTGQVIGLLGPNGAGKSTSMRMAAGYYRPTSGAVKLAGYDVWKAPLEAKKHLGYLPERAPLYSDASCLEYLSYIGQLKGLRGKKLKQDIDYAIEACSLQPVKNQITRTLSKGFKHRVCLAQSLLADPEVLIFDEPTDGLDPNQKQEIRNLVDRIKRNKAIVISTHILEEVEAMCTDVYVMHRGQRVFNGSAQALQALSSDKDVLHVELTDGHSNKLIDELERHPVISRVHIVSAEKHRTRLELALKPELNEDRGEHCTPGTSIIKMICDTAAKHGASIQEISRNNGSSAESFRQLTHA